eukprot:11623758-Prorocentrum_lima.AAC.1
MALDFEHATAIAIRGRPINATEIDKRRCTAFQGRDILEYVRAKTFQNTIMQSLLWLSEAWYPNNTTEKALQ